MTDIKKVLEERGNRYGSFIDNATVAQNIKNALENGTLFYEMAPDQQEALHQIASKISRIVTGDPNYDDSWVDIVGYSQLVVDRLKKDERIAKAYRMESEENNEKIKTP